MRALEVVGVAPELALGDDGALEGGLLLGDEPDVTVAQVRAQPPRGDRLRPATAM